jgi:hypothetical protein
MTAEFAPFLRARFDEDEARYRQTASDADWAKDSPDYNESYIVAEAERMLIEVEAKRRMLAVHVSEKPWPDLPEQCERCSDVEKWNPAEYPCETVRLLALPYAGHPDYDLAWAPSSAAVT